MIKVAILEDNKKYLDCLASGINSFPDCKVLHKLHNALHIVENFAAEEPDIALLDINMPGISGIEGAAIIRKEFPRVQCVMLTVMADIELVFRSIQNGAKGYLLKDRDPLPKIIDALRILHNGNYNEEFPLNGSLAKQILNYQLQKEKSFDQKLEPYKLTPRQKEILKYLYEGKTYKEIAALCSISVDTLNTHIKTIYPKLHINSRGELMGRLG